MLLEILVCPENKTSVKPAGVELIEKINSGIAAGAVRSERFCVASASLR